MLMPANVIMIAACHLAFLFILTVVTQNRRAQQGISYTCQFVVLEVTMIRQFQSPGQLSLAIICGYDVTDTIALGFGDFTVIDLTVLCR